MTKKGKNLNQIIAKTATQWKARAKQDRTNRREISRAQGFALELLDFMELHHITQKELAEKMSVSPQQVNKILRAKANLTFQTLDKIADALGVSITSPKIKMHNNLLSQTMVVSQMHIVHRRKSKSMQETVNTTSVTKVNPILNTSFESMNDYGYTAKQI